MEEIKRDLTKLKQKGKEFRKEVGQQTLGYIVAAFGLVAALAWNEAIKSLIEYLLPLGQNTLFAKLIYAIIITLLVVLVSVYLVRFSKKEDKQ